MILAIDNDESILEVISIVLQDTGLDKVANNWKAECYLSKPFNISELAKMVNVHLTIA